MKGIDLTRQESKILNQIDLSQALARALARNREGLRFVATGLLAINAIWLVFGAIGYGLAAIHFFENPRRSHEPLFGILRTILHGQAPEGAAYDLAQSCRLQKRTSENGRPRQGSKILPKDFRAVRRQETSRANIS